MTVKPPGLRRCVKVVKAAVICGPRRAAVSKKECNAPMKHLLFVLVLAACGGSSSPKTVTPPTGPAPKWKDMDADQRMAFMKSTVLPRAKKLFGDFDPKKYAVVNCHTCHGKGSEDGS